MSDLRSGYLVRTVTGNYDIVLRTDVLPTGEAQATVFMGTGVTVDYKCDEHTVVRNVVTETFCNFRAIMSEFQEEDKGQ